jgi:hypothetical protein
MARLVVEARDSHRRLLGFYSIDCFPATIGRGYSNDVIIADPYVCANHLLVETVEQGWQVSDQSQLNGLHTEQGRQQNLQVNSGDELVIGKTHLRFFAADHPVSPARNLHEKLNILQALKGFSIAWLLVSLLVIMFAVNAYMSASREIHVERLIAGTLPIVAGVVVWASVWSLLAYIVRRRTYFYYFLTVSTVYVLLDFGLEILVNIVAFNILDDWLAHALSYFTGGLLLAALFYASMQRAFSIPQRRRLLLANGFSWGVVMAIVFVVYANQPEFNRNPEYPAELKVPLMRLAPLQPLDVFISDAEKMTNDFDD